MLSPVQIVRSVEGRDHRRLVDRLLANGRCHSRLAGDALRQPEALMPAAIGLGLQRICELAYAPVPEGSDLAHRLIRLQRRDGLFGPPHSISGPQHLIAGTAVALRGMIDWRHQFQHRDDESALLDQCIDRALDAIAWLFHADADAEVDEAALAVALWQLGDCERAGARLPMAKIRLRITQAAPEFLRDDLPRLALTMAA